MEENSVDAIVTDPPYGLEFMGKEWDKLGRLNGYADRTMDVTRDPDSPGGRHGVQYGAKVNRRCRVCGHYEYSGTPCQCGPSARWDIQAGLIQQEWHYRWAVEALRVLKPGGHVLAFGGTRTAHRLVCALEDAGFEVRDTICWLYGSGFPKSLDVSKAIDKAAGAVTPLDERQTLRQAQGARQGSAREGARWQGWGTALKPGHEPVCVARKPLSERNVSANVLRWGTGGLNVDGCRVSVAAGDRQAIKGSTRGPIAGQGYVGDFGLQGNFEALGYHPEGRWPANVCLSHSEECAEAGGCAPHCAVRMLDEQSGPRASAPFVGQGAHRNILGDGPGCEYSGRGYDDTGGASRFFYCAKASRAEREAGLDTVERGTAAQLYGDGFSTATKCDPAMHTPEGVAARPHVRNHHPTVKPVELMRWLVRLATPANGTVLDPFAGSGTTGMACALEGFGFVGFEQDGGYAEIARLRIAWAEAEVARSPARLQEGEAQELAAGLSQGSVFGGQERP